jgi:HEAT repeat protein
MTIEQEIKQLKSDLFTADNWDKRKTSSSRLFEIGGQENIDYLIGLLDQENSLVRNAVAMTFMDNKFNEALEPLLISINKAEHIKSRGTLVYALNALDCSQKLRELFDILFSATRNWEVQSGILTVLEEQEFEFSVDDLQHIKQKWDGLKSNWNQLNGVDKDNLRKYEIDEDLVQDFVDGYMAYLEKS